MPKKVLSGVVVSMRETTVKVDVIETKKHPILGKPIKRKKSYLAHNISFECVVGSKISIQECKPISKNKKWLVIA
jgi:small subunit ribosomal protein S17